MHLFLFRPYPGEILEHAPFFFLLLFAIQSGRAHCSSLSERPRDRASHQRLGPLFRLLMPVGVWAHKPAQAISTYLLPVQLLQLPDMGAAVNAATARPTQRRHCTAVSVTTPASWRNGTSFFENN